MQLVELVKLLISIHRLSKINKNWVEVKRVYLLCLKLIVSIAVTRYMTEGLMCLFLVLLAFGILTHPLVIQFIMASDIYRVIHYFYIFKKV